MAKVVTLRRQRDFDQLFESGQRYHHELLATVVRLRPGSDQARVAFIVGKKVDKRAVVRNRVKRRLREAWRSELPGIKGGVDVAFVVQPAAAEARFYELAAVMHQHLAEAGVLE